LQNPFIQQFTTSYYVSGCVGMGIRFLQTFFTDIYLFPEICFTIIDSHPVVNRLIIFFEDVSVLWEGEATYSQNP
jgi:hypothetical protein